MRISLVNSNFTEQIIPNFMINFEAGLLSIASVLEKHGHDVKIVNLFQLIKKRRLAADSLFCAVAARRIAEQGSDIIGFNSRCDTYPIVLDIARHCKQINPKAVIVIGGPQATFSAMDTLKNFTFVDLIVKGEGELTMLELMNCLKHGKSLNGVAGTMFRQNGSIIENQPRKLIRDLDDLPLPAYHLIEDYFPSSKELRYGWAYISIGRGCPYNCTFCSTGEFWERCYRIRSPESILEEIELLKKQYSISRFYLGHDNFLTRKKDIAKLCDVLSRRKAEIKWTCSSRIDSIDAKLLKKMSDSGCDRIFFGVESGSPRIQRQIRKNIDLSTVAGVIRECGKYDISAILSFIIGFPQERQEDIDATLKLALQSRFFGNCHSYIRPLTPIVGTVLYSQNREKLRLSDTWSHLYLIGSLIKKCEWSKNLIKKYPAMFSNFYSLRLKYLPDDFPFMIVTLFSTLFGAYPVSFYFATEQFKLHPVSLMNKFRRWAKQRKVIFNGETRLLNRKMIIKYFPKFLRELCRTGNGDSLNNLQHILQCEIRNYRRVSSKLGG